MRGVVGRPMHISVASVLLAVLAFDWILGPLDTAAGVSDRFLGLHTRVVGTARYSTRYRSEERRVLYG